MIEKEIALYNCFEITEKLPTGYDLTQVFEKKPNGAWRSWYKANAPVRLCPIYGDMRKCANCDYFTIVFEDSGGMRNDCSKSFTEYSTKEVSSLVRLAQEHNCEVRKF